MSNLIPDTIFLISMLVILITCLKGYEISLLYLDRKWGGLIIISIVIAYILIMILSFLAVGYAFYYVRYIMGIYILSAEFLKLETSIYLLINTLSAYFISSKFKKDTMNYFINKELIAVKEY